MGDFSVEKLFLFLLFALPGAVAIRVYSLCNPNPIKDWKESLTDALIYSAIVATGWLIFSRESVLGFTELAEVKNGDANLQVVRATIAYRFELIYYVLLTPTVLSCIWYQFRMRFGQQYLGFDHPSRTAWDFVFCRKKSYYIIFCLKSKSLDGKQQICVGYFGRFSYVAAYPHDPEIYVERVHCISEGRIGQRIPHTAGMLIKLAECERLEFMIDTTPLGIGESRRSEWIAGLASRHRWKKSFPKLVDWYNCILYFSQEKKLWRRRN